MSERAVITERFMIFLFVVLSCLACYRYGKRAADRWWQGAIKADHDARCGQPVPQKRQMLCAGETCVDDADDTWICDDKGCRPAVEIVKQGDCVKIHSDGTNSIVKKVPCTTNITDGSVVWP